MVSQTGGPRLTLSCRKKIRFSFCRSGACPGAAAAGRRKLSSRNAVGIVASFTASKFSNPELGLMSEQPDDIVLKQPDGLARVALDWRPTPAD